MENPKYQFVLSGFSEVMGFRIFTFEGVGVDRARTTFTIKTDLEMARRYGIRLQELPLLCRAVLERHHDEQATNLTFTYTEEDMNLYASTAAARAEAAKQKKVPRKRTATQLGAAWRVPAR